jgi:hypothetical protein
MKTAVEWFEDQVGHNSLMGLKEFNEIFEKAKAMEKKQLKKAYNSDRPNLCAFTEGTAFKEYYNETFNKSINNKG